MNPTYTDIIKQIGSQLNLRKKSLFIRTLMIMWPLLLAMIIGYVLTKQFGEESVKAMLITTPYLFYVITYAILSFIYMWIMGFIFEIEKRIWVDSFFDKKEILPAKSWHISKKLLWPAIVFRFSVFIKYSLLPIVIFIGIIYSSVIFFANKQLYADNSNILFTAIGILIASIIGFFVCFYYLRIKLRFSWFVFLDTYKGGSVDNAKIFDRMSQLNTVAKSDGFKKALVIAIGTDSVKAIMTTTVDVMSKGISMLATNIPGIGDAGKLIGGLTKVYGDQLAQQIASYSEIVGIYLLYMVAQKEAFGNEQGVNEYVYGL